MPRRLAASLCLALVTAVLASPPAAAQPAEMEGDGPTAALFQAARAGDLETIRRWLDGGGSVDAADRYGQTTLAFAAAAGATEVVRLLLEHGADPDRRESFYGTRPLDRALDERHYETAALLLAAGAADREAALRTAIEESEIALARAAIESGPIYDSELGRWSAASDLDPAIRELLARASTRPDPQPPTRTVEELHAFTGIFEGWVSDTRVEVVLREGALLAALDGAPFERLTAEAGESFTGPSGDPHLDFFGRAGTIEGLRLTGSGRSGDVLRRSVAEPVTATVAAPATTDEPARTTVHWPAFRGANASGIGDAGPGVAEIPSAFDLDSGDGILWRTDIPGLGNSSPVVWGERLFVTTAVARGEVAGISTGLTGAGSGHRDAVEHSWRVLALDKRTGARLWDTEVALAVPASGRHFKATQANSTPATDGRYLVVVFPTIGLACLDLDGNVLWHRELGALSTGAFTDPGLEWGFASSPILYGDQVILQVDVHQEQYLAAWDLESGELVWKTERDVAPSWATPTVASGPEGDELVVNGSTIHAYDPHTGRELWSLGPNSELVIATPVAGDGVVYIASGYPPVKPIYAVRPGLRGDHVVAPGEPSEPLVWSHRLGGAYMPTPLLYRGLYYVVHHNGRIVAYEPHSGSAIYKKRFSAGGTFTGSPVAANGKLFVPTEEGQLYTLAAGPEYRELGVSEAGEPLMATPAISEGILFLRTPSRVIAVSAEATPADSP